MCVCVYVCVCVCGVCVCVYVCVVCVSVCARGHNQIYSKRVSCHCRYRTSHKKEVASN